MYNVNMKNIINTSELQRKGLKDIYQTIDEYGEAFIINQRNKKVLKLIDNNNKHLLINIIKSIKSIKKELKEQFGIEQVGIFGSYSRGENVPDSDLDLIVDFKYNSFKDVFKVEDFLMKKIGIKKIDLVTQDKINSFARETMMRDVIYV